MQEFHDNTTAASDRLPIGISDVKVRRVQPDLYDSAAPAFQLKWGKRISLPTFVVRDGRPLHSRFPGKLRFTRRTA